MAHAGNLMRRIDAHQHFWRLERGDYDWLRPDNAALAPIYRDFLPDDFAALRQRHTIAGTVLVQAAASEAETAYMLGLAAGTEFIAGVVGWVDVANPASVGALERFAADPGFKSVRPMLQDLPDPMWIATAPDRGVIQALTGLGLRFDALVKTPHLDALLAFVDAYPDLPVVIDHAAKPDLAAGWRGDWAPRWHAGITALAQRPQVMCKLSGLLTEMAHAPRPSPGAAREAILPVWERLITAFGPQRLIWGSDWPVLTLAAAYDDWVDLAGGLIGRLSADEQRAIWHDNAVRFYGLAVPEPTA